MKVGEKVICVKDGTWKNNSGYSGFCDMPIKNEIYTITSISNTGNEIYISIKELNVNYPNPPIFNIKQFRPFEEFFLIKEEEELELCY